MSNKPRYDIGQSSLVGDRRNNQDRCILVESEGSVLLALGDGMGGHPKGEVAAQTLIDISARLLRAANKPVRDPAALLVRILQTAHEGIQLYGQSQEPPIEPRTTAVVVLIQQGIAYWAHAGDSRLYLFRNARKLLRTTDHSYVERLRQQGIISVQQQEHHPQRNFVTRCLGGHSTLPETTQGKQTLQVGDTLMLCSDGLWGSIDEELMADVLYSEAGMGEITEMLAREAAQSAFPESDNVTLIALRLLAIGDTGREPPVTRKPPLSRQDDLATAVSDLQNAINNFQREKQKE